MKFGADRKRLAILGGLALVGAYVSWNAFFSPGDGTPSAGARVPAAPAVSASASSGAADSARVIARRSGGRNRPTDWNPPYKTPGVTVNPDKVDPTLRLDLLAKVQQVEVSGVQRNLFQFGEASRPADNSPLPNPGKIIVAASPAFVGPLAPPPPPPKPAPPPITLKYYGYASPRSSNRKRAFFLDGEDIIVAAEGELIKSRYRLVKIGVNSVTMQDTQFNNEQTLPLAEDIAG